MAEGYADNAESEKSQRLTLFYTQRGLLMLLHERRWISVCDGGERQSAASLLVVAAAGGWAAAVAAAGM
jgi:hypothetical protein